EGNGDARLSAQFERERSPGDRGQPAADHGVGAEVSPLDVVEVHRAPVAVRAPLQLPVQLRHHLVRRGPALERVTVRPVRGGEDVAVGHRLTDPDRHRLLPDRDVQEAGQVTRPEAVLDLLLEVPVQQHLAQELAQPLLRERPALALDLHHEGEFMLRTVTLVAQWERMLAGLPGDWDDVRVVLRVADEGTASRAAALLGPLMPGRSGREVRFYAARRGAGPSPASVRRALARPD